MTETCTTYLPIADASQRPVDASSSPDALTFSILAEPTGSVEDATVMQGAPERLSSRDRFFRSRFERLALAGLTSIGLAGGLAVAEAAPAQANSGHTYAVTGTGGDGVWLHGDPGLGDKGDLIEVVPEGAIFNTDCYVIDTPVGDSHNPAWLHITYNNKQGWVTDFFTTSRWNRNNTLQQQGLPICGQETIPNKQDSSALTQAPTDAKTDGATVFYAPGTIDSPADVTLRAEGNVSRWTSQNCSTEQADDFPEVVDGEPVTTLAGWSIGRLGPIYFLQQNPSGNKRDNIEQIVLFDPGSKAEYEKNQCDQKYDQSALLAKWLGESTTHRLIILSGETTRDKKHPSADYAHAGIQNVLFPDIRNRNIKEQVLVCNYKYAGTDRDLSHRDTYNRFKFVLDNNQDFSSCPGASGVDLQAAWRP